MEVVDGATLRGICSSYFESHVSPVLRYIQQAQEQINTQLQDIRERSARQADMIEELRRTSAPKADAGEDDSPGDGEDSSGGIRGGRRASTGHGPLRDTPREGVATLVRLQDLTAAVKTKADARSVPTLAQFHRLETAVGQKASAKDLPADLISILARKADAESVPTLNQLQQIERKIEELSADIRQKIAPQADSLEGSPEVVSPEKAPAPAAADGPGEKAGMKKVQMTIAAAGVRFDRQVRDLRERVRKLEEDAAKRYGAPQAEADSDLSGRWPGRRLGPLSECDGIPDSHSDAGSVGAGSRAGSLAESVTAGLSPEEKAELRKIQAVVVAAGTAFSKELRDVRGQMRELRDEMSSATSRRGIKDYTHMPVVVRKRGFGGTPGPQPHECLLH